MYAYFVYDGVTGPTPLANLKAGEAVNTMDMLFGFTRGTIGETSVIAIMIGAMFLILMGVIDLRIPGSYIVSFVVFIVLFGGHGLDAQYITAHLCGGGLMLGAWFMATDYVTSPITSSGKIIYGICMGLLTGLFRLFGGSAEGVSYAIIISNLLVPLIEKMLHGRLEPPLNRRPGENVEVPRVRQRRRPFRFRPRLPLWPRKNLKPVVSLYSGPPRLRRLLGRKDLVC